MIINSQAAVGAWPMLTSQPAPQDSDHDGMPDAWEDAHGLDSTDPADGRKTRTVTAIQISKRTSTLVPLCP